MTTETLASPTAPTLDLPVAATETKSRWTLGLCMALLVLFAILSYSATRTKTATYDEPLHAMAGYMIRNFDDYRIDPEDPALFTWLSALPHGSGGLKVDREHPMMGNGKARDNPTTQPLVTEQHDLQWLYAVQTLYRTEGNDPDAYINRSRLIFTGIGLATGALLCWWAWSIAGRLGAFAATAAYALDPNFIGHASLVKNDVPLALVTVGLMCAIWRSGRRVTWLNLSGIAVALAAAMNMKFSGPVFYIIAFAALLIRAMMNESWPMLKWNLATRFQRLVGVAGIFIASGVVSYIAIWACYGFRYAPTADPDVHFDFDAIVKRYNENRWKIEHGPYTPITPEDQKLIDEMPAPRIANITRWAMDHRLLPETWLHGFFYTYATTIMRGAFLHGEHSITGWWYFFPLCILYKTPTSLLICGVIALVVGVILWWRRGLQHWDLLLAFSLIMLLARITVWMKGWRISHEWNVVWTMFILVPLGVRAIPVLLRSSSASYVWAGACVVVPIVIYGGMAITSNFNLGIRHVLPLLPFFHLGAGLFVARMLWGWGKLGAFLAAGLGIALAIESCSAWPNYIAFFNVPSGGWRGGIAKLSDSNLDWGQDLKLLAEWQKTHREKPLFLCYFGMADPEYYGIVRTEMPGGFPFSPTFGYPNAPSIIAMSATNYQGTYLSPELRKVYEELMRAEPRQVLGGTIYLYDFPIRPPIVQK